MPRAVPEAVWHGVWFALVCGVAFLIPYLGVSLLDLQLPSRIFNPPATTS